MQQPAPTSAYEKTQPADHPAKAFDAGSFKTAAQPQALLEELQMVKLEGRYFCFDRHEAKNRTGVLHYRDGNRGLVIEVSPRFGHPSLLAYKVLQAVFRQITQSGKPYPDTVVFGQRELGALVGRSTFGGRDAQQLHQAISQLRNTNVELYVYEDDKTIVKDTADTRPPTPKLSKPFKTWSFSILANLGFVGTGDATQPQHINAAVLRLDSTIAQSLRDGRYAIYNWERLSDMEPLTAALYKRLYLHLSNLYETQYSRSTLKFEKDYEAVCAEWLGGLKPERYLSRIHQQLQPHIEHLKRSGLIASATVQVKAKSTANALNKKSGFKLVFIPAQGFFDDYKTFYKRTPDKLSALKDHSPTKAPNSLHADPSNKVSHTAQNSALKTTLQTVAHFYQKLHGLNSDHNPIYPESDVAYATKMIEKLGNQGFTELLDFALVKARQTKFAMQSIKAVETYLVAWQADKSKTAAQSHQRKAEELQRQQAQQRQWLETEYSRYVETQREAYLNSLSVTEHELLMQEAIEIVSPESPVGTPTHNLMLKVTLKTLTNQRLQNRAQLQGFDAWCKSMQATLKTSKPPTLSESDNV